MTRSGRLRGCSRPREVSVGVLLAALLVSACSTPRPPFLEAQVPVPDPPSSWALRHHLLDVENLRVVTQRVSSGEESTGVSLLDPATRQTEDCHVVVSDPGTRGPDNMTGEKITTTFDGHRAVRNGTGAEADYLMWQLSDDSWVEVSCASFGSRTAIDRVASAVEFERTTFRIPFAVELPADYQVSSVEVDLVRPGATMYLQPRHQQRGSRGDIMITVGFPDPAPQPTGDPTTLGGRPALTGSGEIAPSVWVQLQGQWMLIGSYAGDTGPYPDRSDELPLLEDLAASVTVANDLEDPTTWFSAENVLG